MKKILFISYSNDNLNKVNLITKELINHPLFEALVVANNREINRALVDKVTDGIKKSYRVIAILTKDSFKTQWINQEIGYAHGTGIKVIPIVEECIMDELKGLIHKNNDLSYHYKTSDGIKMREENKSFMFWFRLLIKDLEKELTPKISKPTLVFGNPVRNSIDPVANAVKENLQITSNLRKPLGIKVRSAEICPETGIWMSATTPSKSKKIEVGSTMPQLNSRNVKWKLVRYS